jgi:hypothetical protein
MARASSAAKPATGSSAVAGAWTLPFRRPARCAVHDRSMGQVDGMRGGGPREKRDAVAPSQYIQRATAGRSGGYPGCECAMDNQMSRALKSDSVSPLSP